MNPEIGKFLVVLGLAMAGVGALLWLTPLGSWLGRLPGDLHWSSSRVSVHIPLATCLVVSVVLSLIIWLVKR